MSKSEVFSHPWADQYLSFTIGVLQGKHVICSRKGRVHLAIIAKERLKEHGFDWHCKRIDNWIHRTSKLEQPKVDSQQSKREGSLRPKISFEKWLEGLN